MTTEARYDAVAEFYDTMSPDDYTASPDVALFELVGPVEGLWVLDVACGQGRISRELARRGATVVGVDISAALVDRAQVAEQAPPLGITYQVADIAAAGAAEIGGTDDQLFDLATCHFGLSDIDDLDGAVAAIRRLVRTGGSFVFTILHPCYPGGGDDRAPSWSPGGYFDERWWATTAASSTLRQQVGANHRTLSTYLNTLVRHGLDIEQVAEPSPPPDWDPVPTYVVARCRAD